MLHFSNVLFSFRLSVPNRLEKEIPEGLALHQPMMSFFIPSKTLKTHIFVLKQQPTLILSSFPKGCETCLSCSQTIPRVNVYRYVKSHKYIVSYFILNIQHCCNCFLAIFSSQRYQHKMGKVTISEDLISRK